MLKAILFYLIIVIWALFQWTGIEIKAQSTLDSLSLEQLTDFAAGQTFLAEEAVFLKKQVAFDFEIFKASLKPQLSGAANLPNFIRTSQDVVQPNGTIAFQSIAYNNSALELAIRQNIAATGGRIAVFSGVQRFDDFDLNIKSYNGFPVRIGFFQPVFGFNSFKWDKKILPVRVNEANKKFQSDIEVVKLQGVQLFSDLLLAYLDLQIAQSNKSSNQALFDIAKERYELGNISYNNLIQLQLELVSAAKNEKLAEQAMVQASAAIYNFLGLNHQGQMVIPAVPEVKDSLIIEVSKAVEEAEANRFETDLFLRSFLEAERDIAAARGTGGLNATISGSFGLTRSASNLGDIYRNPQQEQLLQVQLNIPIWDWGLQRNRVDAAITNQQYILKKINQDKIDFQTQIEQTVLRFQYLRQQLGFTKEIERMASERFEISKQSYVLGAISLTDLTLSQREKDQALREYMNTLSQYWLIYYRIRALTLYDFKNNQKIVN